MVSTTTDYFPSISPHSLLAQLASAPYTRPSSTLLTYETQIVTQ